MRGWILLIALEVVVALAMSKGDLNPAHNSKNCSQVGNSLVCP